MSNQMRRLMRRMGAGGNQQSRGGLYLPQGAYSPEDEQDRRRDSLAERLLEIGLEHTRIVTDCHKREPVVDAAGDQKYVENVPVLTAEQWYVKLAEAAMKAAEVIYPEIPSGAEVVHEGMDRLGIPLPAAAQEGAQAVLGTVDALLNDQKTVVEGCWPMTAEEYTRRLAAGEVGGRKVVIDHAQGGAETVSIRGEG